MANTPGDKIYSQLAGAETFHPASAELFTDWNLQSGDVVTVKSDSNSYSVPIYNLRLKWQGQPVVDIESTGNETRKPLSAQKRKDYASESAEYENEKATKRLSGGSGSLSSKVAEIEGVLYEAGLQVDPVSGVLLYATEKGKDYALGASLTVQAEKIEELITKTGINEMTGETESIYHRVTSTADEWTSVIGGLDGTIESIIEQKRESIVLAAKTVNIDGINLNIDSVVSDLRSKVTKISNLFTKDGHIGTLFVDRALYYGGHFISRDAIVINGVTYNVLAWSGKGTNR